MFESLSQRLETAFKQLRGEGKISEINIASAIKEIRRALVDADVNYRIAKEFTDQVRTRAIGEKVIQSISPRQLIIKIVQDELTALMGGSESGIDLTGKPSVILVAGLQGSGKTTFCAKLARYLKTRQGKTVLLTAADVYRPAAIQQLQVLGEQVETPVYTEPESRDPVSIAGNAVKEARSKGIQVVILDTAGRLAVDEAMMQEVADIREAVHPQEILFVVDSMTGQDAVNTAKAFNDRLNFTGVVLSKLDGDTRGGAALSIRFTVDKPIKFVSMGEKPESLDVFYPERMAHRILGMGDITTLVERAQAQFDGEQAARMEKKIRKNQFDFEDFRQQLGMIRKMGNIKDLVSMIPGIGNQVKDLDISEDAFVKIESIIGSMTPQERSNPDLMDGSRKRRIASGCGRDIQEVNQFMKQFEQMRQMMKTMNKMGGPGAMKGIARNKFPAPK
ncbi:MAG TPA: signal recognition particle protein [Chitinophagaceae bacterium]|nr:signal recognition particle protein [Chitinophagaceae bacterium]